MTQEHEAARLRIGWLGRRGSDRPAGPPPSLDRAEIEELVRLAVDGLERMYDPAREVLFTRRFDRAVERDDRLSLRYTVMSSLGLNDAIRAGFSVPLDPRRLLESGLVQFAGDDIDHLSMALWSNAALEAGMEGRILPRLLPRLRDPGAIERSLGRVLAWALIGLTLHAQAHPGEAEVRELARALFAFARERLWCEAGGLFFRRGRGNDFIRAQALFSQQIYWVYAFAVYGRAFGEPDAVRMAGRCADRLLALRDPFGGFAWRYDARSGKVTERYPVYSVHQDGMAPMALFALADADGRDVRLANQESLAWLRRNQLGVPMVDEERKVIYRALRRVFPLNRLFRQAGWLAALTDFQGPGEHPGFLRLNATCRPYHLGWLLHAFAPRLDRI